MVEAGACGPGDTEVSLQHKDARLGAASEVLLTPNGSIGDRQVAAQAQGLSVPWWLSIIFARATLAQK